MLPGVAVTDEPVVALRPVPGLHVYVLAPLAVSVDEPPLPLQIVGLELVTLMVGVGLTTILIDCVLLQPLVVPVTE